MTLQPQVGVRDHEPDPDQASLLETAQELVPEALGLTLAHGDAEHLAVAEGIDADDNDDGPGDHLHVVAQESLDLLACALAQFGDGEEEVAHLGREHPLAVAVAMGGSLTVARSRGGGRP